MRRIGEKERGVRKKKKGESMHLKARLGREGIEVTMNEEEKGRLGYHSTTKKKKKTRE